MLFDPARHEPLLALAWDPDRARQCIAQIVHDTEQRFDPQRLWPAHPRDLSPGDNPEQAFTPLYYGACGVVWALHYLQDLGAVRLRRDYLQHLDAIQQRNRAWLAASGDDGAGSYLMGDTPFALLACAGPAPRPGACATLERLIEATIEHPARELMWGSPGTLLAALLVHERSGEERWAELFRRTARRLWAQLLWSEEFACHYWMQDLYGSQGSYLDAVHGFVATAAPLIRGRRLLGAGEWNDWQQCIVNTIARTATRQGGQLNWRAMLLTPQGRAPAYLMQFCHGAPGFVICLADLPVPDLDAVLLQAGETIWAAGPLTKGSNLCHGTGGNGYALLKLYQRTGDVRWLERARAFAMHGIGQTEADALRHGQQRYSLWTGDPGFAIYLWDCLRAVAAFPTLDVFFAPGARPAAA